MANLTTTIKQDDDLMDFILNIVYISILCVLSPVITLSSIMTIFTVVYDRALHTPHNYLIFMLVSLDLIISVLEMPFRIVERASHNYLIWPVDTCFYFELCAEMITFIYLYILCSLCIDKCFKLNFPFFYRNHVTNKTIVLVVAVITLFQILLFVYKILSVDRNEFISCVHSYIELMLETTFIELLIMFGVCIALCIQMTYITKKRRGQLRKEASQIVLLNDILAVLFIFAYLPTVAYQYAMMYYDIEFKNWINDITQLMRYVTPLSNGFALYFTRPVYKESFKLLLTTNPLNWRNIKRETQSKKMAEFSQFTRPINTVHTPCIQKKSEKDLARPTSNLGKSKSRELSLTSLKSLASQKSSTGKMKLETKRSSL